jgi:hypothetical protein
MIHVLRFVAAVVRWLRRFSAEREAEIIYLRQPLMVLKRTAPARPRLKATDRLIFVCLYRLFHSLLDASIVFKPDTLLRWHWIGFRLFGAGVTAASRSPCPGGQYPKSCSAHQSGEPALGCAAHPWRAAQARHRRRSVDGSQVHGATTWASVAELEDLPSQSRAGYRRY